MKFNNGLTDAQLERLALLSEECGEVVQMVGKTIRHGFESFHPRDENQTSNRRLLENEIGNIIVALEFLVEAEDLSEDRITAAIEAKKLTVGKYLHHQTPEQEPQAILSGPRESLL